MRRFNRRRRNVTIASRILNIAIIFIDHLRYTQCQKKRERGEPQKYNNNDDKKLEESRIQ